MVESVSIKEHKVGFLVCFCSREVWGGGRAFRYAYEEGTGVYTEATPTS